MLGKRTSGEGSTGVALAVGALVGLTDLLSAAHAVTPLSRKPYLQSLTRTSVTILWRTPTPALQAVEFGETAAFGQRVDDAVATTHHEVTLTGLIPGTRYRYRIVEADTTVSSSGLYSFRTDAGRSKRWFSFFVTADIGARLDKPNFQHITQAQIRSMSPQADFGLLAGDIIYPDGASERYDPQLMTPWSELLCSTPVWAALGNHDWRTPPEDNFEVEWALPGNEHYYSFDYGNAHFIALDTSDEAFYDEANQLAFLENDLRRAWGATWTFVFYHHPLLTCTYKGNLDDMAAKALPLFQRYGVDVVFTGHAHTFERLFPIRDGQPVDQAQEPFYVDPQGTVFVVSGCGGKFKEGEPTTYCGPTATFVDERVLFTQVYVQDHTLFLVTVDSHTGELVDYASITKTSAVSDALPAPAVARLHPNVPNPFNPATTIPFELERETRVTLDVYRPDGRWVRRLTQGVRGPGLHRVVWNGRDAAGRPVGSGVYVVKLGSDAASESMKMLLVR